MDIIITWLTNENLPQIKPSPVQQSLPLAVIILPTHTNLSLYKWVWVDQEHGIR